MKRIILLLLLFVTPVFGETFSISGPIKYNGEYHVVISGTYDSNSFKEFKKLYDEHKNEVLIVHANSPGGNADDIIKIMDLVREHNKTIWVVSDKSVCDSCCALTAISSKQVYGKLRFHGITNSTTGKLNPFMNAQVMNRLSSYGIPNSQIQMMLGYVLVPFNYE